MAPSSFQSIQGPPNLVSIFSQRYPGLFQNRVLLPACSSAWSSLPGFPSAKHIPRNPCKEHPLSGPAQVPGSLLGAPGHAQCSSMGTGTSTGQWSGSESSAPAAAPPPAGEGLSLSCRVSERTMGGNAQEPRTVPDVRWGLALPSPHPLTTELPQCPSAVNGLTAGSSAPPSPPTRCRSALLRGETCPVSA